MHRPLPHQSKDGLLEALVDPIAFFNYTGLTLTPAHCASPSPLPSSNSPLHDQIITDNDNNNHTACIIDLPSSRPPSPWHHNFHLPPLLFLHPIDDSWLNSLPPLLPTPPHTPSVSDSLQLAVNSGASSPSSQSDDGICTWNESANSHMSLAFFDDTEALLPVSDTQPTLPGQRPEETDGSSRKKRKPLDPTFEPRFMLVTRSLEDVLDDGFKWRNYGQKSTKSSIYPRKYYKCRYARCPAGSHLLYKRTVELLAYYVKHCI